MSKKIRNAKAVQSKSRQHIVAHVAGNVYTVTSASSGSRYTVRYSEQGSTCDCNWGSYRSSHDRRSACSHVLSVVNFAAQAAGASSISAWTDEAQAARQHRRMMDIGDGVLVTVRA